MTVKILAVTPGYYPEVGGTALATYLITDLLAKDERIHLTVLTGVKNPKRINGVKYIYDPLLKRIDKRYIPVSQLNRRYGDIIKSNDIVYIVNAFPLIPVAKRFGKKVIVHLHDYRPISPSAVVLAGKTNLSNLGLLKEGFYTLLIQRRGVKGLIKNILNVPYTLQIRRWVCMADTILAVSRRHVEILSKYMPECKNKIKVLYNPIPKFPQFE
ncbi:MAG: hypothetical protein QXL96_11925, partial [Ignisphaera sp.]